MAKGFIAESHGRLELTLVRKAVTDVEVDMPIAEMQIILRAQERMERAQQILREAERAAMSRPPEVLDLPPDTQVEPIEIKGRR